MMTSTGPRYDDLSALFFNCTLKPSPQLSHTQGLIDRSAAIMTWNLLHLARMLKDAGGIPAHGNQRSGWDAGCRYDFDNPEYR
jgi:hypothetical protein